MALKDQAVRRPKALGGWRGRAGAAPEADEGTLLRLPLDLDERRSTSWAAMSVLGGIVGLALVLRFASLGLQSYHHDEVVTAMRVLPGSFGEMLHKVRAGESTPPLYYALAWAWTKLFGVGEVGLRSLSAVAGAATVPFGYMIGARILNRRAGLILTALIAVNPMLIWYSQEARSYALVVFFGSLALVFFARALERRSGRDLAWWAMASAAALWSHYFAIFAIGAEGLLLLVFLRDKWPLVLAAIAAVGCAGVPLLPLLAAQANPAHIGWIGQIPLPARLWQTAVSFSSGETGHVIAEVPRSRFALVPLLVAWAAAAFLVVFGRRRERRAFALALVIGLGVIGGATLAAVAGHDYVTERNLLPALVPLLLAVAAGLGVGDRLRLGAILAIALCGYWVAFDLHVTQTPNLQRPDFRAAATALGRPGAVPRVIVTWRLAADPLRFYMADPPRRIFRGDVRVREVDLLRKPVAKRRPSGLPPSFRRRGVTRINRLTVVRYVSRRPVRISLATLRHLPTGFGVDAVLFEARTRPMQGGR